ncbi:hypothetical protein C8R45DRAFT_1148598 [Mycena sanguinolenta]|nr:hypothetical protein C8R45DRAFT_1148598 [Mycena sanguinolenta]
MKEISSFGGSSTIGALTQTTSSPISDISTSTQTTSQQIVSASAVTIQAVHRNGGQAGAIGGTAATVVTSILVVGFLVFLGLRWHRRRIRERRLPKPFDTSIGTQSTDAKVSPESQLVELPALGEAQLKDNHATAEANPFADPESGRLADLSGAAPEEAVTSPSGPQQMRHEATMSLRLRQLQAQSQGLLGLGSPPSPPPSYCTE